MQDACKRESEILHAAVKEQEALVQKTTQLTKKQEADREHLAQNITELQNRQELARIVQQEISEKEQALKREFEEKKQLNKNHQLETESQLQEIEELRHQDKVLREEATGTQAELTRLSDFCSQTSTATNDCKVEVDKIKLSQQGLSVGSLWRLVVVLWMIFFYLYIKLPSKIWN